MATATARAPVNIAVIKYWGKRDEKLVLPVNSSLSITLHIDSLCSTTSVTAVQGMGQDVMELNGVPEPIKPGSRLAVVISECRARAQDLTDPQSGKLVIAKSDWKSYGIKIVSHNNFPTAAGLASSASGLACLTAALATLFAIKEEYPGELSGIARQGSGSACRSMYGGFVRWELGHRADGLDSLASQVAPETFWDDLVVLVLVAGSHQKDVSSTAGMQTSVENSELLKYRAESVVPRRMKAMEEHIRNKDFARFAELMMADSNQFHAVCLDTYPPLFYLNETSKSIIRLVHTLNSKNREVRVGYTFDAGPNAVLVTPRQHLAELISKVAEEFEPPVAGDFVEDRLGLLEPKELEMLKYKDSKSRSRSTGVERIILTKIGPGPETSLKVH